MRFSRSRLQLIVLGSLVIGGCGGATDESSKQVQRSTTRAEVVAPQRGGRGEQRAYRFIPATYRDDDELVLPVAFTDGTRAELVYPPKLDVAELGVRPYGSGRLNGKSPAPGRADVVGRDFWIFYGDLDDVLAFIDGGASPRLLARYRGADGQMVGLWDLQSHRFSGRAYLGFQFGRWAVLVYDYAGAAGMTDPERASWTASFSGRETEDGFLLLTGSGPLRLAQPGNHAGPELAFGPESSSLTLFPGRCRPHRGQTRLVGGKLVQWRSGFADWCLSDSMRVHATGRDGFIGKLIRHLAVRDIDLVETGERSEEAHG